MSVKVHQPKGFSPVSMESWSVYDDGELPQSYTVDLPSCDRLREEWHYLFERAFLGDEAARRQFYEQWADAEAHHTPYVRFERKVGLLVWVLNAESTSNPLRNLLTSSMQFTMLPKVVVDKGAYERGVAGLWVRSPDLVLRCDFECFTWRDSITSLVHESFQGLPGDGEQGYPLRGGHEDWRTRCEYLLYKALVQEFFRRLRAYEIARG